MQNLQKILGALCIFAFAIFYASFAWGFVTYKFWHWFIVPAFRSAPLLTLLQSIGIYTFLAVVKTSKTIIKKEYREGYDAYLPWVSPLFVLGIGYIIQMVIS